MFNWITDYIRHVENHPKEFGQDVKDNIRQIKELITRPTIYYKEADPIAFQKFARLFKHREGIWAGQPIELSIEQRYIVACVLGIKVWNNREKRYVRYFDEMDIFVARKWGKDTFTTVLICYFVGLDKEPSAWAQSDSRSCTASWACWSEESSWWRRRKHLVSCMRTTG